ncbi:MAG: enoyl-CoA hydratase/isomerase family protein [Deltaproteobacteria bacterium]|nr:enoyl-CoA hydratase/isomerase family protein [Deltaproteobacteria bacterium]
MEYENILYEVKNGIAKITINRPPYNVLDIKTMRDINQALQEVKEGQRDLKLLIITHAGDKAFSTGVDVKDHTPDKVDEMIEVFHRIFRIMVTLDLPTLAVVNGFALGGGCEVAIFCDMVIASEKSQFGQPEVKVGVYPSMVVAWLHRLIGWKKALEIILTGDTINAQEAERIGLINLAVPEENFAEEVEKFINRLTDKSPVVLKWAKKAVLAGLDVDFERALQNSEIIYKQALMRTHDANEGLKAFMEKRKTVWKGE